MFRGRCQHCFRPYSTIKPTGSSGRTSGPRVRAISGFRFSDLQSALDAAVEEGQVSAVVTTSAFNPSTHRQIFLSFLFYDVDYGYKKGNRKVKAFMSHRAAELQDQINEYFEAESPKSDGGHYGILYSRPPTLSGKT